MAEPLLRQQILEDLERLSPEQQRRAFQLVRGVAEPSPRGASIDDLLPLVGTLDPDSAREMRDAIELHCEQVEPDGW